MVRQAGRRNWSGLYLRSWVSSRRLGFCFLQTTESLRVDRIYQQGSQESRVQAVGLAGQLLTERRHDGVRGALEHALELLHPGDRRRHVRLLVALLVLGRRRTSRVRFSDGIDVQVFARFQFLRCFRRGGGRHLSLYLAKCCKQ